MPAILIEILKMLLGFGAGGLASGAAKRFLAPAAGKAIGRVVPGLAGQSLGRAGKAIGLPTVGAAGSGALGLGGFFGGIAGFDAVTQAALGGQAGEPPQDDTIDDVLQRMRQGMPFGREQDAGLQRVFEESQVREALELIGVDFNEFSELAGSRTQGLI